MELNTDPPPPATAILARYAGGIRLEALPPDVVLAARSCLLDWIGVTLAGSADAVMAPVIELVAEDGGAAAASLLGHGRKVPAAAAAMVNAAASHVHDYDDTHFGMYGHPSAAPIGAAMAVAERQASGGKALLEAVVAGVEATCRLGALMGYEPYQRGFSPSSQSGVFGAAIAAGRLLGLDEDASCRAIGFAASRANGLHAMVFSTAATLQTGHAAGAGVVSADLARKGVTATRNALECAKGYVLSRQLRPDWRVLLGSLGERFKILDVMFKFHAACGGAQPGIEAVRRLKADGAMPLEEVARIEIRVSPTIDRLCSIGIPQTGAEAKLSLPFCLSAALLDRDTASIEAYHDRALADEAVGSLMRRVSVQRDASLAEWDSAVTLVGHGGGSATRLMRADSRVEDLQAQWTRLEDKFLRLATPVIGAARAGLAVSALREIERPEAWPALLAAIHGKGSSSTRSSP